MGFLPWEKWLPPYVYGPLLCVGSIWLLIDSPGWWALLFAPLGAFGAWGTWVWFRNRRNVFWEADPNKR